MSVVYFVQLGKSIKIGFSRNLAGRLKSFETAATEVYLLLAIAGDVALERRLHRLLEECKIARELFRREFRVTSFIRMASEGDVERGLAWLEETTPGRREQIKREEHEARVAAVRQTKAEFDAQCAAAVSERKRRLGW